MAHPGHGAAEVAALFGGALLIPLLTSFATGGGRSRSLALHRRRTDRGWRSSSSRSDVTGVIGFLLFLGGLVMAILGTSPRSPAPAEPRGHVDVTGRGLMTKYPRARRRSRLMVLVPEATCRSCHVLQPRLILTAASGDVASLWPSDPSKPGRRSAFNPGVTVSELKPGGSVKFIAESCPDGRIAAVVSETAIYLAAPASVVRKSAGIGSW